MKIANAALLFLAFEGGAKVHGFSAYLNALTGPAAFAKSSYAISQSNPQTSQPVKSGNDYLSGISGPESLLKAPTNEYLGSSQQPNGYGAQPPPITASTSTTGTSYLNSVGGGAAAAAAKPASYSPFGSKPKAVESSSPSYLGNLKDASPIQYTAPPPAAAQPQPQSYVSPPQVQPASYSPFGAKPKSVAESGYLGGLTGGVTMQASTYSAPAASAAAPPAASSAAPASYSPFGAKPKQVAESGYLGNLGGSSPAVQYTPPPPAASQVQPQSYTTPPQVKPSSYSPFGAKPKAVAESGYLGNLNGGAPAVQYTAPPAAASQAQPQSYAAPPQVKPSSYSPFGAKPKAVAESGYLGNLNGAPAVQYSAPPAAASQAQPQSYATPPQVKPSSYSPFGAKPKAVAETGYLGNLNGGAAPAQTSTYSASVAASTAPPQASVSAAPKSYSPFGAKPKAVAESGYLGNLNGAPSAAQYTAPPAAASQAQPQSYAAPPQVKPSSYSPFGAKPKAVAETGYLGGLGGSSFQASSAPVAAAAPPAVTSAPPTSYSPFGSKPKAVAESGYLGGLNGGATVASAVATSTPAASVAPPSFSSAPPTSYSPFGSKPKAVAETGYLGGLSSGASAVASQPPSVTAAPPAVSSAPPTSYSPFGSKPKAVAETGYLGGLTGGATMAASVAPPQPAASTVQSAVSSSSPSSYSPFGSKPKAVAESGYLGGLTGGATVSASSYASSSPPAVSSAPPAASSAAPASYSPFGSKPKAVAESGYLGNLAGATMTTSSYAPAATSPPSATFNEVKPASYSPFGSKPRAPENQSGYLGGLAGTTMTSTVSSAPAAAQVAPPAAPAAASRPASYAGFGTKPKAVATGGYLGSL